MPIEQLLLTLWHVRIGRGLESMMIHGIDAYGILGHKPKFRAIPLSRDKDSSRIIDQSSTVSLRKPPLESQVSRWTDRRLCDMSGT